MKTRLLPVLYCFFQIPPLLFPLQIQAEETSREKLPEVKPLEAASFAASGSPAEIREVQKSMRLDVTTARSRCFRTKQKLLRVSVSDPNVADVAVVSEHEFIVNGKAPGALTLIIWCEK